MASPNNKSSSPAVKTTYYRRRRQIPATVSAAQPVPKVQPSMQKFSALWWKEVRAAGAHRRAIYFGPLTRAGNYQDDFDDDELARIQAMAVPEPHQEASVVQEPAISELILAGSTIETEIRELRSKRQANNQRSAPTSSSREEVHNASLNLLAAMALNAEENQAGPSEPVTRQKGKEPMVSEDEEESYWEDYVQFSAEQDSEDNVEVSVEPVQRDETVEKEEEDEEQHLRPTKQQVQKRVTRSDLKRRAAAASVAGAATKRAKKVIVLDSKGTSSHTESDPIPPENQAESNEIDEEEEEIEAEANVQADARAVFQYNIRARTPFWENGFSAALKQPPFIKRIVDHYGWHNLCQQPEGTSMGMVRAFYRNFDEEEYTSEVRGISIDATPAVINRIYGLIDRYAPETSRRIFDPTATELQRALRTVAK